VLVACGPTGSADPPAPTDLVPEVEPVPNPLGVYTDLGYIVGNRDFPAVGSLVYLPGPADSSFVILALSLSNNTLRFRRDPPDFLARYRVAVTVGDTLLPVATLDEIEEVRVSTFRETSRRAESVIFQAYIKLLPGQYPTRIEVRDLASTAGFIFNTFIQVPRFGESFVTPPIVVHQAEPRAHRADPPSLIINPRATIDFQEGRSQVYIECSSDSTQPAVIQATEEGHVISTDTLAFRPDSGILRVAIGNLDVTQFPAGALTLRATIPGIVPTDSTQLIVALAPDWVAPDYQTAIGYLRYAGTSAQLDSLATARPWERAHLLHSFWGKRDHVPETTENEFFERYFRRVRDANDRFSEATTAGWLTDRGSVYIVFGPPDQVLRHLEAGQGPQQSQVWLYNESLETELRLVFSDPTATGAYALTIESRRAFFAAIQTLYS
jgi:GWxTD domain-containing protein